MNKHKRWYVVTIDQKILRAEDKMRDLIGWCQERTPGRVLATTHRPDGWYEVAIGASAQDCHRWYMAQGLILAEEGFDLDKAPLYSSDDKPEGD